MPIMILTLLLLGLLILILCPRITGSSITNYHSDQILNVMRGTNITAPGTRAVALYTVSPTDVAGSGTEVTNANAYARQSVTFAVPAAFTGGGRYISNSAAVNFPQATPGAWGTIVAAQMLDSTTYGAGNAYWWGLLTTSVIIGALKTKSFDIGDLVIAID
jgi:hypothetical protein